MFSAIAVLPIALWELSMCIWLVAKGFDPQGLARLGWATNEPIDLRAQPATRLVGDSAGA